MQVILAATDFSTHANLAIERAVELARLRGARLLLAHAFAPVSTSRLDLSILPPNFEADVAKATLQRLEQDAAGLRHHGIEVSTSIRRGAPAETILEIAAEEQAELIVLGTQGLEGFEHALLGSVAEAVSGRARCPVLVVHQNDVPMLDPPSRILLPTDRSSDTDHVVDAVEALFGTENAEGSSIELILAHADRIPPFLVPAMGDLTGVSVLPFSQVSEELSRLLEPTEAKLRERGFEVRVAVRDGEPASSMIDLAGQQDVDLIAMSTHGRSAVKRLVLGSTARRIVQHAPCPVLTVRDPADRS